ncbi:MAG: glycosyl hydrolase 2 galactose-binding domain-containing protein [Arachnia sp.]
MKTLSLNGNWTLTAAGGPSAQLLEGSVAASVPGCVHLDLMAAGIIDDPFDGDNESAHQWIGSTTWRYRRSFEWAGNTHQRHDLVAHGLDTLATVVLNGTVLAQTENQHRSYRWSIGHLLKPGTNEVEITFDAPVPAAERRESERGGPRFHVNHHPYNALRKTASNFGWDWGIDVATSGIWRPIEIQSWSDLRIAAVRPLVDLAGDSGILTAHIELDRDLVPHPREVVVTLSRGGIEVARERTHLAEAGQVRLVVPEVELWWPRGHGAPALYQLTVSAGDDSWHHEIGFRTIELDTAPDAEGTPFQLRVNGRDITVRGANWIPDDAFVTRIDTQRLERRIRDATEANMNLLRVWGGGMYESEDFYAICSREGVMVWQDFLFACAAYAEEAWLADEIIAEAREAVTRLSKHPGLVLWCGNNENLVGFAEWGWRGSLAGRTWGQGYYFEILPGILDELDPTRPYIPGSPFSASPLLDPNRHTDGTVHIWDVWNELDYTHYRDWRPRFCAEFGFQGPAAYTTLFGAVHDSPLTPESPELLVHQKAKHGNLKLQRGYEPHLPRPTTMDDWHFTTQLNQAHALRFAISWFRSLTPYNTGTLVWQLNDNWPVISWAAVDFAERRKPLWYALREVYAPRFATVQPDGSDGLELVVLNDTDEPFHGSWHGVRLRFDGTELASQSSQIHVAARGVTRAGLAPRLTAPGDATRELLAVSFTSQGAHQDGPARVLHDFAEVVEQRLAPEAISTARVAPQPDGATLEVTARQYLRDVVILADRADPSATVDTSVVSLLPGERFTFRLRADRPLEAAEVVAPTVLRSANQLLAGPTGVALPPSPAS